MYDRIVKGKFYFPRDKKIVVNRNCADGLKIKEAAAGVPRKAHHQNLFFRISL